MDILKKVLGVFKESTPAPKSKEEENEEIISIYQQIKRAVPDYCEPNYTLAEKVFRDFNDFNLKNIEEISPIYLSYIPKSLLPYPKNYIKCAYYLFLEYAKKNNNLEIFKLIEGIGVYLFFEYPDYERYKENLKTRSRWDVAFEDKEEKPRDAFKRIYGVYEVSEEDYNSSPNSVDSTEDKLIHDFGFIPDIEEDVDLISIRKNK